MSQNRNGANATVWFHFLMPPRATGVHNGGRCAVTHAALIFQRSLAVAKKERKINTEKKIRHYLVSANSINRMNIFKSRTSNEEQNNQEFKMDTQ